MTTSSEFPIEVIRSLLEDWGLVWTEDPTPLRPGVSGDVWKVITQRGSLVVKLIRDDWGGNLRASLELSRKVEAAGIPAGAPIPTGDGRIVVPIPRVGGASFLVVLTYLDGAALDNTLADPAELGGLLGHVHATLRNQSIDPLGRQIDDLVRFSISEHCPAWLRQAALAEADEVRRAWT